jgi:hypothetical protein
LMPVSRIRATSCADISPPWKRDEYTPYSTSAILQNLHATCTLMSEFRAQSPRVILRDSLLQSEWHLEMELHRYYFSQMFRIYWLFCRLFFLFLRWKASQNLIQVWHFSTFTNLCYLKIEEFGL